MKIFKFFSILAVAAILLGPVAAEARGPRFSFSFNFVDAFLPPPPPPVAVPVYVAYPHPQPVYVERYPVYIERQGPECYVQELRPVCPHCRCY